MTSSADALIDRLMLPCSLVMSRLGLRTKLLCMFATFMLPMALLAVHIVLKDHREVSIANAELQGVVAARQITEVMIQTQKHRGQVNLKLSGQDMEAPLAQTRAALGQALDRLDAHIQHTPQFELAASWKPLADELRQLAAGQIAPSAADSLAQHSRLIAAILRFSALANEKSGLLLDPEAASYLLMDVAVQKMPVWIEHMAILRGLGAGYLKSGTLEFAGKAGLISRLDALQAAMRAVGDMEDALGRAGENLGTEQRAAQQASQAFAATARQNLLGETVSGDAAEYFSQGTQAIEQTVALQLRLEDRLSALLNQRVDFLSYRRNLIIAILALALLVTGYLVLGFYRGFMRALHEVRHAALAVADGDLTNQIYIQGKDELAQTGNTLEQMNFNLSALVANVRTNASMVLQLGEQLANGIGDLTVRTEQQASSLEQTAASVQDLADTVQKNAGSAQAVDGLAANVRQIAEAGGDTMRAAVASMQGIQGSALKVQEIVSMIDAIAFQTNILALNAAVEAARAGEQGRGFAVVASEVRGLAQRSADSARQIKHLIADAVERVDTGVTQINHVNRTLGDIVAGIRDLASNINAISTASSEQSNGLAQISEAIRHLDEITQSNGQMAEQAKHASLNLEERAHALSKAVSSFKLRQGTADEAHALVKRAVALYRTSGKAALQAITANREQLYADRDMYVFAFDRHGQYRAFAGNPAKLQVNLANISGLDSRKLIQQAFAIPASGGWVDYSIVNPVLQKIEAKTSYIEPVEDGIVLGCGVYKIV